MKLQKYHEHNYNFFSVYCAHNDKEPIMVIRSNKKGYTDAWVIPLSMAYMYADSQTGAATPHLIGRSIQMAQMFGIDPSKSNVRKIGEAILDTIPELKDMPPPPQITRFDLDKQLEKAGAIIKVDNQTLVDAT